MRRAYEEQEYRRGLILGLTMAEVLILLLFLLLLTLSLAILKDRERFAADRSSYEGRIAQLERTTRQLAPLTERLGRGETLSDSEVTEMASLLGRAGELESTLRQVEQERDQLRIERDDLAAVTRRIDPSAPPAVVLRRGLEALTETRQLQERLREAEQRLVEQQSQLAQAQQSRDDATRELQALDDALAQARQIDPEASPATTLRQGLEALAERREAANASSESPERQITELRRDLSELRQRLERTARERDNLMRRGGGRGLTWPSCFIDDGGQSQSIFRITIINDNSVRVQEISPPAQAQHEVWRLPRAAQFRGRSDEGPRSAFQAMFAEIFQWSVANNCRFISRLSDATCESCKQQWNSGRLWVGGFFYPDER